LGIISSPWEIYCVDLKLEEQRVDIVIEYTDDEGLCPECGACCPKYDERKERTWQHLDTMQFSTYLHCAAPRVRCKTHGVKTVSIPWAGKNRPPGTALPLPRWLLHRYWVIQHVYAQQWEMYQNKSRRCDDRIVSISQPHVRPIVRGKLNKPVEFGAKLSVSLSGEGIACVGRLRWDAFHEGHDLEAQVEAYKERYGHYPEVVLGDPVYGTRDNRRYLKKHGIRFAGKPLGRPKKESGENKEKLNRLKAQRREDYRQRIPIEGKFGQGKNGYRLNYIRAKRADTSLAWINGIFLVMNLLVLLRIFFGLGKSAMADLVFRLRNPGPGKECLVSGVGGVLSPKRGWGWL